MAIQPKKKKPTTRSKTLNREKPALKKSTTKPRKYNKKNKSNVKRNTFIFFTLLLVGAFVAFGFYLGKNSDELSVSIQSVEVEEDYTTKQLLEDLAKIKTVKPREEAKQTVKPKHIIEDNGKIKVTFKKVESKKIKAVKPKSRKPNISKTSLINTSKKPRLAIIIDDISKKSQMNAIKATGVVMTPSIFPPSELSMRSHHLARGLKHVMIHLPMESGNAQLNTQYKTLLTHFSTEQVNARVAELRRLFPRIRYVNNHTGSVFTSNTQSMKKLYRALRSEGFIFIDSRTIGSSKVRKIAHSFGDAYISRDIFIDNIHTVSYIHKQLKKAVHIAKKKGYAVAIGHPHKVTMEALASANDILKDVELVYIDEIVKRK